MTEPGSASRAAQPEGLMTPDEASRRIRAAATAVTHELRRASQSALGRALPIVIAVVFVATVAAGFLGIADAVAREFLATIVAAGALVVAYAAILGIVLWRILGGPLGAVLDVIVWTARDAQREWTATSPGSSVPKSPIQARKWLATYPETDANRPQRFAAALTAGDHSRARETLGRYPVGTSFERHQLAADRLSLDLVAGQTVTTSEIGAAYAELGPEHGVHAIICRASIEAFAAVLSGDDWRTPLVRAWPGLPTEAKNAGRRQAWLVLLATNVTVFALLLGAVVAAGIFLLG